LKTRTATRGKKKNMWKLVGLKYRLHKILTDKKGGFRMPPQGGVGGGGRIKPGSRCPYVANFTPIQGKNHEKRKKTQREPKQ